MQTQKLLGDSIVDVARFLLAEDRLDKTVNESHLQNCASRESIQLTNIMNETIFQVVGDYLGDPDKFNKEVSNIQLYYFKMMIIWQVYDCSIRTFSGYVAYS